MKNNGITYLLKGISLAILDVVTLMLVFSVWALVNISLFPWALITILFSIFIVNIMVLVSDKCIRLFGIGVYTSALISTFLYYLFVMVFTGLTYFTISSKWYMIFTLIGLLLYVAVISGLYISGINKKQDIVKNEIERDKVLDLKIQLMTLNESINKCCDFIEKADYSEMIKSFNQLNERAESSTPFGRIDKPVVEKFETQIKLELSEINEKICLLKSDEENKDSCKNIVEALNNVKAKIINREKLILQ